MWFRWNRKFRLVDSSDPKRPTAQEIESLGDETTKRDAIKVGDWNDYKVIAVGNHIRSFVNGYQVGDIVDDTSNAPKIGHLALTIYFETLGTLQYKNIKLRVLNGATPAPSASTPPPSTPAASTPKPDTTYTVADAKTLEKALLAQPWTWKPIGSESFPWTEVVFWKDGTMTTSGTATARWDITGPRSVDLFFSTGEHLNLTFHFGFDYFTGSKESGKDMVNGWASPKSEATTPAPAPATPTEKAALEKAILAHSWTWIPIAQQSYPWKEIVFWRDGTMTTSTPANARWTVTGPRTVALDFGGNSRMTLTFYGGLDYYTGASENGKTTVSGKVNTMVPTPVVASTSSGPEPATTEQALIGSKWHFANWIMQFQPGHVIRIDAGGADPNIWHWWVEGPRKVHVQYAAEPATYDASKGTDYTFDATFSSFTGQTKNGEISGTRAVGTETFQSTKLADTSGMRQLVDVQFSRSLVGFTTGNDSKWHLAQENGEYQMLLRDTGLWFPGQPMLQNLRVNDCVCEVRARIAQGAGDGGWGLGFVGGSGTDHPWTGIMVNGRNQVSSHSYDSGPNLPWLSTTAMQPGRVNTLRVEAFGSHFRVFVNGVFLFDREHERLKPNSALTLFAFGDHPPEDIRIQSVQIWVPR